MVEEKTGGEDSVSGPGHLVSVLTAQSGAGAPPVEGQEHGWARGADTEAERGCGAEEGLQGPSSPYVPLCVDTRARLRPGDTPPDVSKHAQPRDGATDIGAGSESEDCYDDEVDDEEDDVTVVLSDDYDPCVTEDEAHYITTHEIQHCELSDHESGDDETCVGSSSSWDLEDENRVHAFVDYSARDAEGEGEDAGVSDPRSRSEESAPKPGEQQQQQQQQCGGHSAGQIHLSIKATSRAINDSIQDQGQILYQRGPVGADGDAEPRCWIAVPGRVHVGRSRGRELTDSSGASSVSELDDADQEVRNLTARAFKSLAGPYLDLDSFNFSTSSDSSASERGFNSWSTFVDLTYGNVSVDKSVVSHLRREDTAHIKPPDPKIFTLSGKPHGASSSAQKIEVMGQFGQGHAGVICLTETLNFRCNVHAATSAGDRRADNPARSRSTDEVTRNVSGGLRRSTVQQPTNNMEEPTQKKAILASSLLKNVLSKKIQFEQERMMERGQIREPPHAHAPDCCARPDTDSAHRGKGNRDLVRHSSRISETGSEYTLLCVDEVGDIVDNDTRTRDAQHKQHEVGTETLKGALLRSANSAFRCWRDEDERDGPTNHKGQQSGQDTARGERQSAEIQGTHTKMSRLFVPRIQLLSTDTKSGQQLQDTDSESGQQLCSNTTLQVAQSTSVATSKSPEIKIKLRSVREQENVSVLRAPAAGGSLAGGVPRAEELRHQLKSEGSDRVPQFTVRDFRDNKGKVTTPIHQVRDVRKLVKSSYHFVSVDNHETKPTPSDTQTEQKKHRHPLSMSPIVIKCLSVNTTNNRQCVDASRGETQDTDRTSPEGARAPPQQWARGKAAVHSPSEGGVAPWTEKDTAVKKQEKTCELTDKKPDSKVSNKAALEKLQAAVKTMEQLYVFERNEWKRKNQNQILMDSHVLPLLSTEDTTGGHEINEWKRKNQPQVLMDSYVLPPLSTADTTRHKDDGARGTMDKTVRQDCCPYTEKTTPALTTPIGKTLLKQEDKDTANGVQSSSGQDDWLFSKWFQASEASRSRNTFSLSSGLETSTDPNVPQQNTKMTQQNTKVTQQNAATQAPVNGRNFVPLSPKLRVSEGVESRELDRSTQDHENYLTIPVKSQTRSTTRLHPTAPQHLGAMSRNPEDNQQTPHHSSCSPEIPSATIYHTLPVGVATNQPQVYCFSPAITPAPTMDPFLATQRKMLLDPTTGNYYLVDTLLQPSTRRLFDPETGQYVDVPLPPPPMTPVPMPMSPMALSPGAYGHTYTIYPGFIPTPSVIPARTLMSQMSVQQEVESFEKAGPQKMEGRYMESPFYMTTGRSSQAAPGPQPPVQTSTSRPQQSFSGIKQPLVSITSQQGPRIIAPPSFDGTTMSFVVEHR